MQAVILAAGMGRRLKELTRDNTKCMVKVNGVTLIERCLNQLDKLNLKKIIIVEGYQGKKLKEYIGTLDVKTPLEFINNPIYNKTNNIYSLALAKDRLKEDDTLLLESDLIFEYGILKMLIDDPRPSLALVDKYESWMDGTCVKLSKDDTIEAFVPGKKFVFEDISKYYKTVNIYKFSKEFSVSYYVPFLEAYEKALGENEYYEQVLRIITMLDEPVIKAKRLDGEKWYEIDDIQDLDIAESIFTSNPDEKVSMLQSRYGGYWRYPRLIDFCYLVNPYFPPKKMRDEIRANFDVLLEDYPSGIRVNSLLAAKNFGVHEENIIVGNGAAELIKCLMSHFSSKVGFIRPTFEEYRHRYDPDKCIEFIPDNMNYSYTEADIMKFFDDKDIEALVVINPDNPSGNYIKKSDMLKLIYWAQKKNIKLVVDESFVDFAEEEDNSLICNEILEANPHLFVMKSISKSYGVPGLRLGVLASGNSDIIADLKKDVAIWNINSFAEFYMQIAEKYNGDYEKSLKKIRAERTRFQCELAKINGIRVIPSQANFIMVELDKKISTVGLMKRLLVKHEILIKDLATKTNGRNYMRLAVRTTEDNNKLLEALKLEITKQ